MKFPIIQLRQDDLLVLTEFDAISIEDGVMRMRHAFSGNTVDCVIDSAGDLWSFRLLRTDHTGLRRLASFFWNVSTDEYGYTTQVDISIGRFREIVAPHRKDQDPHARDIARSLLRAVAGCDPSDLLRRHVHLLNL